MITRIPDAEALLTPAEVATMFRVDPKTVTRWAKAGKLSSIRTLGGHRRYRESEVRDLLTGLLPEQPERLKAKLGQGERLTVLPNDAKTVASFIADHARARTEVGA